MAKKTQRGGLFPALLKHWRGKRGLSQLDLAIAADVSGRHISSLETGRSSPSQAMILRLAAVLDVPLRHANAMLEAAGHPPSYPDSDGTESLPTEVKNAIELMKRHHDPFPLVVVDRAYNMLDLNDGAACLFGLIMPQMADALTGSAEHEPRPRVN